MFYPITDPIPFIVLSSVEHTYEGHVLNISTLHENILEIIVNDKHSLIAHS